MKKVTFFICLLLVAKSFAQIPENGLQGYWPFNGNANDESDNGNDGTVSGATLTDDRNGDAGSNSYSFITDDYITMGPENLGIVDKFTISVWVKTSASGMLVEKYDYTASVKAGYLINIGANGIPSIGGRDGLSDYLSCPATSVINDGNWHHVVGRVDGNLWQIWVDNILEGTFNSPTATVNFSNNMDLNFGGWKYNNSNYLNGALDDIRIYNRTLSPLEITVLFNEAPNTPPPSSSDWQTKDNDIFFYNGEGNVGIGTDSPAAKLTVNGPILATEIKVKADISTFPDFVFKPDYNLRTLEETERFIDQNGHLPDIPSAKQVEEEGISLGEMNAKLLQKIEEQTLYIIQLNKKMETMQNEILKLQKQL